MQGAKRLCAEVGALVSLPHLRGGNLALGAPLAAFIVSFFSSMVGISGAFLLMPFQMSVLGYAGPSASATNLVFNLYATPGGVWRYARDARMAWPLARLIVLGTLPGVVLGFYLRTV